MDQFGGFRLVVVSVFPEGGEGLVDFRGVVLECCGGGFEEADAGSSEDDWGN